MKRPECHGIIPARYASSRFPGKPLVNILGRPMFWHVWQRASLCPDLRSVTLATDDERIFAAAKALGVPVVMTGADHASGSDRVYEAARKLGLPDDAVLINIQGDEPALDPNMLSQLVAPFYLPENLLASSGKLVSTLARAISRAEAESPDRVKVARANNGQALYFSRAAIPFDREGTNSPCLLHIGLYAFTMSALRAFTTFEPSALEQLEKLEQLRFLENNIPIHVVITQGECHGVDKPEDVALVIPLLQASQGARTRGRGEVW